MPSRRRSRNKTISGNLTDLQKRLRYLEHRPSPSKLASKAVVTRNIAPFAVETDLIATANITTRTIANNAITEDKMDTNSVSSDQIQASAVGNTEIANGSITQNKLATDSVGTAQTISGSVIDDKIAGMSSSKLIGNVQDDQIEGLSGEKIIGGIDGNLIVNDSITSAKIADGAVTSAKIADGAVTISEIADGAVTSAKIGASAVTSEKIEIGAVTHPKIAASSVVGSAGSAVTGQVRNIQNFTIGEGDIFSGAVTSVKIATGAVTSAKIGDGAVTSAKIGASAVTFDKTSGFSNLLTTGTVSGTGISRNFSSSGNFRSIDISLNVGTGSNQLAIGNHTHAGGTAVASHTHPLPGTSYSIGGGSHGGHTTPLTGSHTHGVTVTGSTLSNTSTFKAKKEISDHAFDVTKLLTLKLKQYKYKNNYRSLQDGMNREWMYGYIAEEVQEAGIEEILGYDENGEVDSLQYGTLVTLAIELIKKQQNDIELLKEAIQRLEEKI